MAVYTCYDMIRDCQANRAEGWLYLGEAFGPAIESIANHYAGKSDGAAVAEKILRALRSGQGPIPGMKPCHQREFLYQLRPLIVQTATATGEPGDAEIVTNALAPLSATERQAAWFETMAYSAEQTAVLMRMSPETVAKLRDRAAEMLRAGMDSWTTGLLAKQGRSLGEQLEAQVPAEPLEFRHFLDVIDGRITWQRKLEFDRQLESTWSEVHKACAIREADQALAGKPSAETAKERYWAILGVEPKKPSGWRALLARS